MPEHLADETFRATVTLAADPTTALEAATKNYVDTRPQTNEVVVSGTQPTDPAVELWLDVNGSATDLRRSVNVTAVSVTAGAVDGTDYVYVVTAGGVTVTMPTAVGNKNRYTVKHNAASGSITIATTASQTIDGTTQLVIGSRYVSADLISDGTNWCVI